MTTEEITDDRLREEIRKSGHATPADYMREILALRATVALLEAAPLCGDHAEVWYTRRPSIETECIECDHIAEVARLRAERDKSRADERVKHRWATDALVKRDIETARAIKAETRAERLATALDRDRTGLAAALNACRDEIRSRNWILEGRGPYEWDDDRYRAEAGLAFQAALTIIDDALKASGALACAALADEPTPHHAPPG